MSPRFPEVHPAGTVFATMLAIVAVVFLSITECHGQTLEESIGRLQPRLTAVDRARWAEGITKAATPHGIDPVLIAALVMRESSFRPQVADGTIRGALGEVGPLQIHGVALRGVTCRGAGCWLRAGVDFLAHHRTTCPGSTWRWVASYAMRRCPSEAKARASKTARRARYWYDKAGGTTWDG